MTIDFMINHLGEKGALYIDYHPRKNQFGITAEDIVHRSYMYEAGEGFESIEDYEKCIKNNILYQINWYPKNYVTSHVTYYVTYGSTLEKALGVMFEICTNINRPELLN